MLPFPNDCRYTLRPMPTYLEVQKSLEARIKILESELAASRTEHLKTQEQYTKLLREHEYTIKAATEYLIERRSIKP